MERPIVTVCLVFFGVTKLISDREMVDSVEKNRTAPCGENIFGQGNINAKATDCFFVLEDTTSDRFYVFESF